MDFSQLSPLMRDLHAECVKIYYLMLPVFFALSICIQWFKRAQGAIDFLDILKRTILSSLLLVAFPEITDLILKITEGVAGRIDSVQNLDKFMAIAQDKVNNYTLSPSSILLGFNDLFLASLTFISFLCLYIARYLSLAMFHFFWLFLVVTAPLLLLFNIFTSTTQITANLFRGLIEVACWKIVWAILGVMLASLSFGKMYLIEGSYPTVIVMNLVIAIAMLATPLLVRSLMGSGIQGASPLLAASVVAAIPNIVRKGSMASQALRPQARHAKNLPENVHRRRLPTKG